MCDGGHWAGSPRRQTRNLFYIFGSKKGCIGAPASDFASAVLNGGQNLVSSWASGVRWPSFRLWQNLRGSQRLAILPRNLEKQSNCYGYENLHLSFYSATRKQRGQNR